MISWLGLLKALIIGGIGIVSFFFSWVGLLEASVSGGICIALFFCISQLCGEKCPAKYKKVIWLLIALRLCIPISFSLMPQALTVKVPVYVLDARENSSMAGALNDPAADGLETAPTSEASDDGMYTTARVDHDGSITVAGTTKRQITSQSILMILWGCGCAVVILYYLLGNIIFYRRMIQRSESCTNKNIIAMTIKLANELGLKKIPEVRLTSDNQTGPYTVGFFRNTIVLPNKDYHEKDLKYIIRHELVHCANRDTQLKVLFVIINAVHWFNPLVWFMKTLVDQDMELECDEKVLTSASQEERSEYSEVLMSCISTSKIGRTTLSTGYVHGVKFIKKRFHNIYNSQKRLSKAVVCIIVALLILASGLIGFEAGRTVYAGRRIEIDSGIELRTDVTGDGLPDRAYVIDNNDILITNVCLQTADGGFAQFSYNDEMWADSYLVCGDLSGNRAADIVVMRVSFGMHLTGEPSVLYVTEGEEQESLMWQRYPENFIHNPAIDMDQPDKFEDISCLGATVLEENGRHLLRLIALDMVVFDDDTVQCIDCSWQGDGWYIEDMRTVEGYYTENKVDELLRNNNFHITGEDESTDTVNSVSDEASAVATSVGAETTGKDERASFLTKLLDGEKTVSTDASKYMQYDEFRGYSALSIFPETIDETEVIDYFYRYEDTFLDPTAEIYMERYYEEEAYQAEIERLQGIQAELDGEVHRIIYDTVNFSYPAYVTINGNNHCYEYALLLGDRKIAYIFLQFIKEEDVYFPADYLPNAYETEDQGYSMYMFYKETLFGQEGYWVY